MANSNSIRKVSFNCVSFITNEIVNYVYPIIMEERGLGGAT